MRNYRTSRWRVRDRERQYLRVATERSVLKADHIKRLNGTIMIREIGKIVADAFGITLEDIQAKSRWWIDVNARGLAIAIAVRLTSKPKVQIAQILGGIDVSCVHSALTKFDKLIDEVCLQHDIVMPRREKWGIAFNRTLLAYLQRMFDVTAQGAAAYADIGLHSNILRALIRRGYIYKETSSCDGTFWRITVKGRDKLKELELLGNVAEASRSGDKPSNEPGRRSAPHHYDPAHLASHSDITELV